jgi:hypothetical protein
MDKAKRQYVVVPENMVMGPEGTIYNEGDKIVAEQIAAFLNAKHAFEEAIEEVLDRHDYPLTGLEWQEIQRRSAIKGEQS